MWPEDGEAVRLHVDYPTMKGSVYLKGVAYVKLADSVFAFNDGGPILDTGQSLGLTPVQEIYSTHSLLPLAEETRVMRASAIFVDGWTQNATINNCAFSNNSLGLWRERVEQSNSELLQYFPEHYFEYS